MSALPGDRIEQMLVKVGSPVKKGDPLVVLQSLQLRSLELESATLKLEEAKNATQVKRDEARLAITSAQLKLEAAEQMLQQATAQRQLALRSNDQIASLRSQVDLLDQLRRSSLTRAAIGTIELESKKNELNKVVAVNDQSLLAANQAVEMAKLQVVQAEKGLEVATQSSQLVDRISPIASLEKQIELLRLQIEQAKMESPIDGVVLAVNAEVGERVAQLPVIELANLNEMVCVAEVHEADVGMVKIDDPAEMSSSSLSRKIRGKVIRIDRIVGAVQMRFPNPMARSDFRAVPVWIAIDSADAMLASERLQLQVEATITVR
jgi:HlyD family secretion protein